MTGLADKRMTCTECGNTVLNEQSFCEKCGTELDWSEYIEPVQEQGMRYGTVNCSCGQEFYFETINEKIRCINCDKEYNVSEYEEKEEQDEQEGE